MKIEMLTKETFGSMQKELLRRSTDSYPEQEKAVASILERVRLEGDQALFAFEEQFDHCSLDAGTIRVSDREIEEAYEAVPEELVGIIRRAIERIRKFHEQQKQKSWFMTEDNGMVLGQRVTPLQRAGVYVPGGKAAYPSSVLMNVIPAQVAGVGEIIKMSGSIELAPIVGLSEVICDIVETGTTLRENGLTVLEEVCPLSARVVVNQVSMKMFNDRIADLISKLKQALDNQDK